MLEEYFKRKLVVVRLRTNVLGPVMDDYVSRLGDLGYSPRVIALWLGHESPTTTHIYVEADLAMKEKALKKLQTPQMDRQSFERAFEYFTGHGFVRQVKDEVALDKAGKKAAWVFAGSILDFVETYYIVARTMSKHRKKELVLRDWIKRSMKTGTRLVSTGEIRRPEAVHKNIIENAVGYMIDAGICEYEEKSVEKEKSRTQWRIRVTDFTELEKLQQQIEPFLEQ